MTIDSNHLYTSLKHFFVRKDAEYEYYTENYQARTPGQKAFYLFMYFFPGILAFVMINQKPVFDWILNHTGLTGSQYQYIGFIFVTFGIHIALPFLILRFVDKLTLKQSLAFLNLDKFDWKGVLVIAPIFLMAFVFISYPYFIFIARPLRHLLDTIPAFAIPEHSIFRSYQAMFNYSPVQILFLLIGNHIGEEMYFRGYLLKKTAFLGHYAWVANGVFFALYHLWQIPQSWPLFGINILFGLLMVWRKNTYALVVFHFLTNYLWPFLFIVLFGSQPYS